MSGSRVVESLEAAAELRGYPKSITVDNGTEFCSKAVDAVSVSRIIRRDQVVSIGKSGEERLEHPR